MTAGGERPANAAYRAPVSHLLYLHGFRSGPQSTKAKQMAAWVAANRPGVVWACPQLPASPAEALALIHAITAHWPAGTSAVIGSSLGGFYATALAEAVGCRAVLINPAVNPARDLAGKIGKTSAWHSDEVFYFRPDYVTELTAMTQATPTRPTRYFALIAKGDEVLDWREMAGRYPGAAMTLLDGGDHAFSEFEQHIPDIARFLGWPLA